MNMDFDVQGSYLLMENSSRKIAIILRLFILFPLPANSCPAMGVEVLCITIQLINVDFETNCKF
jgi:hypothetical protein